MSCWRAFLELFSWLEYAGFARPICFFRAAAPHLFCQVSPCLKWFLFSVNFLFWVLSILLIFNSVYQVGADRLDYSSMNVKNERTTVTLPLHLLDARLPARTVVHSNERTRPPKLWPVKRWNVCLPCHLLDQLTNRDSTGVEENVLSMGKDINDGGNDEVARTVLYERHWHGWVVRPSNVVYLVEMELSLKWSALASERTWANRGINLHLYAGVFDRYKVD